MAKSLINPDLEEQKLLMLCGPVEDSNVPEVEQGFEKVCKDYGVEIVDKINADGWKAEIASAYIYENMDRVMKADGIMCGNDNLATMVVHALAEKKLAGKMQVVGQDGDLEACQRIVEGTQKMTVYKPIEKLAKTAADLTMRLIEGDSLDELKTMTEGSYTIPYLLLEPQAVDKYNIDAVIIDNGVQMKDDVYLNIPH